MGTVPAAAGRRTGSRAYRAGTCVVLFIFGAVQGLIGSFQYSQSPAPAIAAALVVIIFATCLLGGWGTTSLGGALAPAAGWILASFLMSMGTHQGSVIITNTVAGEWYLYGGTLAAALGAASGFISWLWASPGGYRRRRPR